MMKQSSRLNNECEWLFHHLWLKDFYKPVVNFNFKIPDTVILKYVSPIQLF